jgi:hypothetical protein
MLNITYKLSFFTMCGALLAGGFNASDASNVYNEPLKQAEQEATVAPQPAYWACPAQISAPAATPPAVTQEIAFAR